MSARASAYAKALVVCPNGEAITPREKLVLIVLADNHQDKAKHFTYPAIETIAEDALCDRRSCQRYLASLERKGVIVRRRPPHQGRGMQVFYFFTALDEVPEGWQPAALFDAPLLPVKGGRRAAEGRQKGGNSGSAPVIRAQEREPELEQKQKPTPQPPSPAKGASELDLALDSAACQVSNALGIANRRRRKLLRDVIELEAPNGEGLEELSRRMIAAWNEQAARSPELRVKFGVARFFGEGIWKDQRRWHFDEPELRRRAEARVGS